MSIAEKLVTIAENEHKVYNAGKQEGQLSVWNASESLQGNVSGVAISVNDVSPIKHNVGCTVESKNLFNISNYRIMETSIGFDISALEIGKTYVFSSKKAISQFKISTATSGHNSVNKTDGYGFTEYVFTMARNSNIAQDKTQYLFFKVNNNWINSADELANFDIQIEQGDTKTEYTPYTTDFEGVEVSRYGKNLWALREDFFYNSSSYTNSITASAVENIKIINKLPRNVPLYLSYKVEGDGTDVSLTGKYVYFKFKDDSGRNCWGDFILPDKEIIQITLYGRQNATTQNLYDIQVELGSTATAYEKYIEPITYTSTADGTVDGITSISPNMTLLSNNGAVSINANYYKDPDIVISNLQQAVALTGGE